MPISNVPTFEDGEILTAAKLNQLGSAVEDKFSGSVTGADLAWPLLAQGNVDMNNAYTLVNLRTLWGMINVSEYDSLSDAVAALPSGGGCLFVPPNTTITADGVAIAKPVLILGAGKTSVLRLTGSATSGYLLRTTGSSDFDLVNLTVDGNTETGSAQDGVQIRHTDGARVLNVWFKNFSGNALVVGNDGTGGNNSTDVVVGDCRFEGGAADHININDVDGMLVRTCRFTDTATDCIDGTPTNASSKMRNIVVSGCVFDTCVRAVHIVGASTTVNDLWAKVTLIGSQVFSASGDAVTIGKASAALKHVMVIGNQVIAAGADAFNVESAGGMVVNNYAPNAVSAALDLLASNGVHVYDNVLTDAGGLGVDGTGTTSCRIFRNDLTGSDMDLDGATTPYHGQNIGVTGLGYIRGAVANRINTTGTGAGTLSGTLTIPANTLCRTGDGMRIRVFGSCASGTGTIQVRLATVVVGALDLTGIEVGSNTIDLFLIGAPDAASNTVSAQVSASNSPDIEASRGTLTIDWTQDITVDFNPTGFGGGDALEITSVMFDVIGV